MGSCTSVAMPRAASAATMPGTCALRTSGTFSLKVMPRTRTGPFDVPPPDDCAIWSTMNVAHRVVGAPPGEDDLRVVADLHRPVGQIVGIDADAVAADEARREVQEIPLGAGGVEHVVGGEPEGAEDLRHLVDEGDVDVALGVLDHLGGLGGADVAGDEHVAAVDRAVEGGKPLGDLRRLAGDDLGDVRDPVFGIAGVHALRRIADMEICAGGEPRGALQHGHADVLRDPRPHRALVDHDGALVEAGADGLGRRQHGAQIGALLVVERRWHRDDEDIRAAQVVGVRREPQAGGGEAVGRELAGAVATRPQLVDPRFADVIAQRLEVIAQGDREGQADITETDDCNVHGALSER